MVKVLGEAGNGRKFWKNHAAPVPNKYLWKMLNRPARIESGYMIEAPETHSKPGKSASRSVQARREGFFAVAPLSIITEQLLYMKKREGQLQQSFSCTFYFFRLVPIEILRIVWLSLRGLVLFYSVMTCHNGIKYPKHS